MVTLASWLGKTIKVKAKSAIARKQEVDTDTETMNIFMSNFWQGAKDGSTKRLLCGTKRCWF